MRRWIISYSLPGNEDKRQTTWIMAATAAGAIAKFTELFVDCDVKTVLLDEHHSEVERMGMGLPTGPDPTRSDS